MIYEDTAELNALDWGEEGATNDRFFRRCDRVLTYMMFLSHWTRLCGPYENLRVRIQ